MKKLFMATKKTLTGSKKFFMGLLVAMTAVCVLAVSAFAANPTNPYHIDWATIITQDMIGGLISSVTGIIPLIIPIAFVFIAIKVGIRLFRSQAK